MVAATAVELAATVILNTAQSDLELLVEGFDVKVGVC
jgi:hypothetical protein